MDVEEHIDDDDATIDESLMTFEKYEAVRLKLDICDAK